MKIISPFKDYYDFVQHSLFSGGDGKVVYVRGEIKEQTIKSENNIIWCPHTRRIKTHIVYFKWLIVCGKSYLLLSYHNPVTNTPYKIISKEEYETFLKPSYFYKSTYGMYVGYECPVSLFISKKNKSTYFHH